MVSGFDVHTVALHASLILVLYIQYSLFSVFCHAIYYQSCYRVIQKQCLQMILHFIIQFLYLYIHNPEECQHLYILLSTLPGTLGVESQTTHHLLRLSSLFPQIDLETATCWLHTAMVVEHRIMQTKRILQTTEDTVDKKIYCSLYLLPNLLLGDQEIMFSEDLTLHNALCVLLCITTIYLCTPLYNHYISVYISVLQLYLCELLCIITISLCTSLYYSYTSVNSSV